MNQTLHRNEARSSRWKKLLPLKAASILATVCLLLLLTATTASATHYRYGNITWNRANTTTRTVTFTVNTAWRSSFFVGVAVGATIDPALTLQFGDATAAAVMLTVTSVNPAEDWFTGTYTVTHTYAGTATSFDASYLSGARLSTLQNNANGNFSNHTLVQLTAGNVGSPVSTLPVIVNVPTNLAAATFNVPAVDPDGGVIGYALSTTAEFTGNEPPGIAINGSTGVVTFNTVGKAVGTLWNAAFTMTDPSGSKTVVDFIIRIVNQSTPPYFNYAFTPANNFNYSIQPGQPLSFNVRAQDDDPGSDVVLTAVGLPTGVTFNPALPAGPANPVNSIFSWTPTASQLGVYVITFIATDNDENQATTTVTINVNMNSIFIPPTHPQTPDRIVLTGTQMKDTVVATNPDTAVNTQLTSASLPPGATITPTLPGAFTDSPSAVVTWTPVPSNFGPNTFTYVATDENGHTTTHSYIVVANTPPVFTSTPDTAIDVCETFSYNITITDADIPFGDELEIESHANLPSWLTLTDNGNGTGTLSGTPPGPGTYHVSLVAADLYHHAYPHVHQHFDIHVEEDATPPNAICKNATVNLGANGTATITAAMVNNGSNDACSGVASLTVSPSSFTCANKGANTVTLTVIDSAGNTSTCTATVTVNDVTPPVANCKNITVKLGSNGNATITPAQVNNNSADNCGITSMTLSKTTFNCSNLGANTVTLTVKDASNNTSTCTATVTIQEDHFLQFTQCPGNIFEACQQSENSYGNCSHYSYSYNNNTEDGANVSWETPKASLTGSCTPACPAGNGISGFTYLGSYNGHYYYLSNTSYTWANAKTHAIANGGYLATITSSGENYFLKNEISSCNFEDVWIGLNDASNENTFLWANGEAKTYTNWDDCEPNNSGSSSCTGNADYVRFDINTGKWSDQKGCAAYRYVLELNCTQGYTITRIQGPASGSHFNAGTTTTVKYRAVSNTGDTAYCQFTVKVAQCPKNYCNIEGQNTCYGYINRVKFGDIDKSSGNNGGYRDYMDYSTTESKGSTVPITLYPAGHNGGNRYWRVWIDYNWDGDFTDAGEMVFQAYDDGAVSGNISIPTTAVAGKMLGMRVAMSKTSPPAVCSDLQYGEVEDYTVLLTNGGSWKTIASGENAAMVSSDDIRIYTLYPNPLTQGVSKTVTCEFNSALEEEVQVRVVDFSGRTVQTISHRAIVGFNTVQLNLNEVAAGMYFFEIAGSRNKVSDKLLVQ